VGIGISPGSRKDCILQELPSIKKELNVDFSSDLNWSSFGFEFHAH